MKALDIRKLSSEEIQQKILDGKKELFNLRFQKLNGDLKNTARFKVVRRLIARLKTIAVEKKS